MDIVKQERMYFEQAKLRLGPSMPYKDIGAFRRSYHAREDSFAYKKATIYFSILILIESIKKKQKLNICRKPLNIFKE